MDTTSWITGGAATRDELLDLRPELAAAHRAVLDRVWAGPVAPRTLELCRLRTAMLLQNTVGLSERSPEAHELDNATAAAIASWPTDDRFTEIDRACLALAEQYVLDVHGITDAMVARVADAVGPDGVVALTTALALWELSHRFDNALLAPTPSTSSAPDSKVR
jgi:hypothetical protein